MPSKVQKKSEITNADLFLIIKELQESLVALDKRITRYEASLLKNKEK